MERPRIVVVGSSNTDLTVVSDRLPEPGETVTEGDFYESGGGKGANQSVAARKAGGEVFFVGRVGEDRLGRESIQRLDQYGVNTDFVTFDPETSSGVALIMVDSNGENMISVAPGANRRLTCGHVAASKQLFSDVDALTVQMEIPLEVVDATLRAAKDDGVLTILDPAPVPSDGFPDGILDMVDVVTPNRSEAIKLADGDERLSLVKMAQKIRDRGAETVIITLGSEGAVLSNEDGSCKFPAAHADPVDAVGAGDCFAGVLAVACGEGDDYCGAVKMALCAASLATETEGAQNAMPSRDEILKRMNNYNSEPQTL